VKRFAAYAIATLMLLGAVPSNLRAAEPQRSGPQQRSLIGHVVTHKDVPIEKAIVYLKNTKTLQVTTYISEADGSYRFPFLSPNVDYEVYAEHNGARSDTKTLSGFDNRKQLNVTLRIHSGS
jgi:hypothetical protein